MDLDTLLRETAAVAEPAPGVLAAGRVTLDEHAHRSALRRRAAARARLGRTRAGSARLGRRSRVIALAAMAGAASLALIAGPAIQVGDRRPMATAEAAQVLRAAGRAAGAQPGGWPDAAYWRSVSRYQRGDGTAVRREIWIGHHTPGVLVDPGVTAGVIPLEVGMFPAGGRGLSWDELYALPTEAGALERELRSGINGAGPDDDTELFVIVGDLLRESPAPPALRKALWEVAARVPGVTLVGAVVDGAGRPGIAVERGGVRYVLDPDDGRLLEESQGGGWRSTYLEQGPATEAPSPTATDTKG